MQTRFALMVISALSLLAAPAHAAKQISIKEIRASLKEIIKHQVSGAPTGSCDIWINGKWDTCIQMTQDACDKAGQFLNIPPTTYAYSEWQQGRKCTGHPPH
jgi:hypothetical protein